MPDVLSGSEAAQTVGTVCTTVPNFLNCTLEEGIYILMCIAHSALPGLFIYKC